MQVQKQTQTVTQQNKQIMHLGQSLEVSETAAAKAQNELTIAVSGVDRLSAELSRALQSITSLEATLASERQRHDAAHSGETCLISSVTLHSVLCLRSDIVETNYRIKFHRDLLLNCVINWIRKNTATKYAILLNHRVPDNTNKNSCKQLLEQQFVFSTFMYGFKHGQLDIPIRHNVKS